MKTGLLKRCLMLLLALVMIVSVMPMQVFATETETHDHEHDHAEEIVNTEETPQDTEHEHTYVVGADTEGWTDEMLEIQALIDEYIEYYLLSDNRMVLPEGELSDEEWESVCAKSRTSWST